ncbi:hypothetical protein GCK72_014668 [Caenorhabditis remanei]|uniref:Ion transport domain-containing protein n=1 Tax=Caenorhabditis remanei TaxID=31234 RepID=A0A6A5GS30_CAERE|nr:hypothetical protein GCK72_014668 [Caenorhabditis remanei]KAF1758210.1 hypothetical protein GCK72_014668 [Caenorhabditis remanei]
MSVEDPQVVRNEIMEIINFYQEKFKTLTFLTLTTENGIYHKIREILLQELNIKLEILFKKDQKAFIMIVAAFFGQKYALEEVSNDAGKSYKNTNFLPLCKYPLHTVLVMCFAAHSMHKLLLKNENKHGLKQDKYLKLKEHLEEVSCKIINHLFSSENDGNDKARAALQEECNFSNEGTSEQNGITIYRDYLNRKFEKSKEIMAIAYKAKAMKFLSQKPCHILMEERYNSRKNIGNTLVSNENTHDQAHDQTHQKYFNWRLSMKYKRWMHVISRTAYIILFAYMLCRFPIYADYGKLETRSWKDIFPLTFVLSVLFAQITMTAIKFTDYMNYETSVSEKETVKKNNDDRSKLKIKRKSWARLLVKYSENNQLAFWRSILVVTLYILESIRLGYYSNAHKKKPTDLNIWHGGWVLVPILLELLYCSLFIIATVSSIRYLYSFHSVGFFVHMIKKMLKTVFVFTLTFLLFWIVLAVVYVSISRTFTNSENTIIHTVTSIGKFEIFGEVQDNDRLGKLDGCGNFNRTVLDFFDMEYTEASCLFRSSIIPFLVFAYIFVTGILLINLLTAQLTKEYENESENSRYYDGYLRYEQLAKIESKLYLPPPFSWIYVAFRVLISILLCGCHKPTQTAHPTSSSSLPNAATDDIRSSRSVETVPDDVNSPFVQAIDSSSVKTIGSQYISFVYTIWKMTVEKIEGSPWGTACATVNRIKYKDEVVKFLKKSSDEIWEKLKEIIQSCESKEADETILIEAQHKIVQLFEKEKNTEIERIMAESKMEADEIWEKLKEIIQSYAKKEIDETILTEAQNEITQFFEEEKKKERERRMVESRMEVIANLPYVDEEEDDRSIPTPLPTTDL